MKNEMTIAEMTDAALGMKGTKERDLFEWAEAKIITAGYNLSCSGERDGNLCNCINEQIENNKGAAKIYYAGIKKFQTWLEEN